MEDQSLRMDEGRIFIGMFALKEKVVGEFLPVYYILLRYSGGMNSDKRLQGKFYLSRREQKFCFNNIRRCVWDGAVYGCENEANGLMSLFCFVLFFHRNCGSLEYSAEEKCGGSGSFF